MWILRSLPSWNKELQKLVKCFVLAQKQFGNYQRILGSCIIQVYKSPEQGIALGWFEFSTAKPDRFRSLGPVPGEQVSLPDPTLQKPAVHWQRLVTESMITLGQGDVMGIQTRWCPGPLLPPQHGKTQQWTDSLDGLLMHKEPEIFKIPFIVYS